MIVSEVICDFVEVYFVKLCWWVWVIMFMLNKEFVMSFFLVVVFFVSFVVSIFLFI